MRFRPLRCANGPGVDRRQGLSRAGRMHSGDVLAVGRRHALRAHRRLARNDLRLPRQPLRSPARRVADRRSRRSTTPCSTRSTIAARPRDYYRARAGRRRRRISAPRSSATCAPNSASLTHYAARARRARPGSPGTTRELQTIKHARRLRAAKSCAGRGTREHAESFPGLYWWEFAAACGSSLPGLRVDLPRLAKPRIDTRAIGAHLARAYFPNMSAVHILLDYFIDQAEDRENRELNFVACYSLERGRGRTGRARLIRAAGNRLRALAHGEWHEFVLRAMCLFYLTHRKGLRTAARSRKRRRTGRIMQNRLRALGLGAALPPDRLSAGAYHDHGVRAISSNGEYAVEDRFLDMPSADGALDAANAVAALPHYAGTPGDYKLATTPPPPPAPPPQVANITHITSTREREEDDDDDDGGGGQVDDDDEEDDDAPPLADASHTSPHIWLVLLVQASTPRSRR